MVSIKEQRIPISPLIAISNHDPVLIGLLQDVLVRQGFNTMVLPHGSTAYQVVKKEKPDLIMLDTAYEDKEPWVLFQILRLDEETIQIPVLICSGVDSYSTTAAELEHHSSVQVLSQPYDSDVLIPKIQAMLDENASSKSS